MFSASSCDFTRCKDETEGHDGTRKTFARPVMSLKTKCFKRCVFFVQDDDEFYYPAWQACKRKREEESRRAKGDRRKRKGNACIKHTVIFVIPPPKDNEDNKDGNFKVSYVAKETGQFELTVEANEEFVPENPFAVEVKPMQFRPAWCWK